MKTNQKILFMLFLALFLTLPLSRVDAQTAQQVSNGSKLVLGGVYNLAEGQTLNGDLYILGGSVDLKPSSTVDGNVTMAGGNLQADGTITGSVISFSGLVQMSSSTTVEGDVNVLGGSLQGENQADIMGKTTTDTGSSLPLVLPGGLNLRIPNFDIHINPVWDFLWLLVQSFIWAAVAVLVALFLPKPTQRVGNAVVSQTVISGGLGLLTAIIVPLLLVFMAITIICIPLALLGGLVLAVAWAFGIIAIGLEAGERLGKMGKADWGLPVSAALGTFLVTLIINSVGKIIPCVGWLLPVVVGLIGLGAVLLTRFGTHAYPIEATPMVVQPVPVVETPVTPAEPEENSDKG